FIFMRLYHLTFYLILMIFFAACAPKPESYEFDLQGHRGARGLMPENTIPGFLKAVDYGVDTIEFDIVVTNDRQLLISHDPWFNHNISTKPDGTPVLEKEEHYHNIFGMTYEETTEYDVGIRGNPDFPGQEPLAVQKPLMRDAIKAIEVYIEEQELKPVKYNIETKSRPEWYGKFVPEPEEFARLLYEELSGLGLLDRVIIQSFDPNTLIAMRELAPEVTQAILVSRRGPLSELLNTLGYTPEIWSPHHQLISVSTIIDARDRDMKIIPWTINSITRMRQLLELGVDGIITDYPNRGATLKR
ncbi:MAG: glycerophosphodiester phosphodiesterase family protein, partial [Balneolaceae bacterium]